MDENFAWLILFLPLAAVAIITLFTRKNPRVSGQISIACVGMAFAISAALFGFFILSDATQLPQMSVPWLVIGDFKAEIGLRLDYLSLPMLLVVTGVGGLIHVYSFAYMSGERGFSRYFACLSLFTFSMLGIVMADNFLMMFIFWELVGVSSYLLIGFWYERASAADACKKAFITNRLGDFGFLLGILMVWALLGSLNFQELQTRAAGHAEEYGAIASLAGLLIFCGAAGKSAQFPLHVWLPDAMEGPTPVSALIHAATMVAAGVYMLCRVFFLLAVPGSIALPAIAWIGGFTALLAALIAVQQNDIKRILAYSTLSQLGYMIMDVGLSARGNGPAPAMFHLTTHAFFKALLFLGAGSVIVALHHEQNIWNMGGLRKKMPVTFWTFTIGALALCGVPPLSGFYSKDGILSDAYATGHYPLFILGVLVAMLTTFYMFRLVFVVFFGGERSPAAGHAHESPGLLTWPLRILAFFSVVGGFIGIENVYARQFAGSGAVEPAMGLAQQLIAPFSHSPLAAAFSIFAVIFGFSAAYALYLNQPKDVLPEKLGWLSRAMRNGFYFDELYDRIIIPCTHEALAKLANTIDRWIISGLMVRGAHGTTEFIGRALRLLQTGNLQTYAFLLVAGLAVLLYLILH
jgi:NADH-quinone oxidoreductase subunit L